MQYESVREMVLRAVLLLGPCRLVRFDESLAAHALGGKA